MFHRSNAVSRTRLIGAGLLSALLMASPLTTSTASAADISLSVLLDGITLNVSQRNTLDREFVQYRQQRNAATARHDARALADARQAYLARVDRILDQKQRQRFHRQFETHYPGVASINIVRAPAIIRTTTARSTGAYTRKTATVKQVARQKITGNSYRKSVRSDTENAARNATGVVSRNAFRNSSKSYARNDVKDYRNTSHKLARD